VGFEFYLREGREGALKRVRVESLNQDGQTYRVMDLRAKAELPRDLHPSEMCVGLAMRSEEDPVIKLLRQIDINEHPFLDPRLTRPGSAVEEFRRPLSRVETFEPLRRSAPPILPNGARVPIRPFNLDAARTFRTGTPLIRGEMRNAGRGAPFPVGEGGFGPFRPSMQAGRPTPVNLARPGGHFGENLGPFGNQFGERERGLREPAMGGDGHAKRGGRTWEQPERRWDPQWQRVEWQRRQNLEIPEGPLRRAFEQRQGAPGGMHEIRRGATRGRTWVRRRGGESDAEEWEEEPQEEEEWEATSARRGMMGAGPGAFARGRRDEAVQQGKDATGEWEPRGRNELRAVRENERNRRARMHALEDDQSGTTEEPRKREETHKKQGKNGGKLESRIEALEYDRRYEKARSGLNSELRRLQSGVSSFEHPGLYSHIDQMVTLHEAPPTHRGPMAVAGAVGDVLKVPHIKLSYLAEGVWEFTRRKCAEGGEHLTDQQILEIEAQVLEYFGKQRVEAGKIMDKAGLTGRGR
jgi:hypothetical protein